MARLTTYLPSIRVASGELVDGPAQENLRVIFDLMFEHPEQERDVITWHPLLAAVALQKAKDMATRSYYSHTDPDGHGPNWWVKRAGYSLPSWYHQQDAANNIESISRVTGGDGSSPIVWDSWLQSPDHRKHVLGLISPYDAQNYVGIGVARVPSTPPIYYWVLLSCPAEGSL